MPFSGPRPKNRFFSIGLAVVTAIALTTEASEAGDGRRSRAFSIGELPSPSRHGYDEIVVEMAPLRPAPGVPQPAPKTAGPSGAEASRASAITTQESKETPVAADPSRSGAPPLALARSGLGSLPASLLFESPADRAARETAGETLAFLAAPQLQLVEAPAGEGTPESSVILLARPVAPEAAPARLAAAASPLDEKEKESEAAPPAQIAPAAPAQPQQQSPTQAAPSTSPASAAPSRQPAPAPKTAPAAASAASHPEAEAARAYASLLAQGVQGPAQIRLADRATLSLPAGRVFLEAEKARRLMGMEQSAWDAATQGLVLPLSKEPQWSAYIDLFDDGHVRDDDTAALDPKSLLAAHKATLAAQNIQRAREGLTLLEITGWFTAPHYDAAQRRFGSCVGATAQGSEDPRDRFVNCSSFILGRQGALKVAVVGDEEQAAVFKGEAAALAEAILYDKGNAYDDADPAKDKIASYGLAALAAGVVAKKATGAAAAAAATAKHAGIFSLLGLALMKLWTLLLVGLLLAAAALWLRSKRRGAPAAPPAPGDDSPQSTLRSRLAALWRKAAALRRKISASKISPIMHGPKVASQAKALAKVATIMRKKAPEEPASAPVDLSRVTGRSSLSTGGPGQTPLAKETGAAQAGDRSHSLAAFTGEDNLGLVEPGDKAAASLAISARAAFKEQRRQA